MTATQPSNPPKRAHLPPSTMSNNESYNPKQWFPNLYEAKLCKYFMLDPYKTADQDLIAEYNEVTSDWNEIKKAVEDIAFIAERVALTAVSHATSATAVPRTFCTAASHNRQ